MLLAVWIICLLLKNGSNVLFFVSGWWMVGMILDGRLCMFFGFGFISIWGLWNICMDLWFGLRIISLSLGIRIGLSNICMLFLDLLLESVGCMWWVFGIR